jgi:integration host factor subunit alpha
MTLTKADIVARLYAQGILSKNEASDAVERSLELMKESLASGRDVLISGFGKWSVRQKSQRRGRNPQTGNPLMLTARRVITFRPSRVLKAAIAGKEGFSPEPSDDGPDQGEKGTGKALRPGYF